MLHAMRILPSTPQNGDYTFCITYILVGPRVTILPFLVMQRNRPQQEMRTDRWHSSNGPSLDNKIAFSITLSHQTFCVIGTPLALFDKTMWFLRIENKLSNVGSPFEWQYKFLQYTFYVKYNTRHTKKIKIKISWNTALTVCIFYTFIFIYRNAPFPRTRLGRVKRTMGRRM